MARKDSENLYPLQTLIPRDAAKYLKDLAKEDDRSVVKYVKKIVMDHLKANGYTEGSVEPLAKNTRKSEEKEDNSQKKSNSIGTEEKLKQSANCSSLSIGTLNKKKKGSNKVAPVPMSFISQ